MIEQVQRVITNIIERVGAQGAAKESLGTPRELTNFDKHHTLKDKPEIPIKKFIGKTVEYNPYGN